MSDIRSIERVASVAQKGRCKLLLLTLHDKGRTDCRMVTASVTAASLTAPNFDLGHHIATLENKNALFNNKAGSQVDAFSSANVTIIIQLNWIELLKSNRTEPYFIDH